jgi:hypothetical protein
VNKSTLLSIITITKNDTSGFEVTRASVERFIGDSQCIEWIVINAGSDLKSKSSRIERVKIVTEEDSGPFAGMNKGLNLATGVHVNFLNSGDEILNSLQREVLLEALQASKNTWGIANAQKETISGFENWKIPKKGSVKFWLGLNSFPHQSTFYKARELRSLQGFNQYSLAADYETSLRFLRDSIPDHFDFYYSRNSMGGISDRTAAGQQAKNIADAHSKVFKMVKIVSLFDFIMIYIARKLSDYKKNRYDSSQN